MDKEKLREMMGITQGEGGNFWKLNKVTMSGDSANFIHTDLVSEREKGVKPKTEDLGKEVSGVILKMRWQLSKYDEPNNSFISSTEYDQKWKDQITVFPMKDKGGVEQMKAKYALGTQRVIYFYVPSHKQIVRLYVKSSGMTGDKNEGGELGLFEHIDSFIETETLPCQFITTCFGVFREGKNKDGSANKRKDHYAMAFKTGRQLNDSEFEKVQNMIIEVSEKTSPAQEQQDESEQKDKMADQVIEEVFRDDTPSPDDIPF